MKKCQERKSWESLEIMRSDTHAFVQIRMHSFRYACIPSDTHTFVRFLFVYTIHLFGLLPVLEGHPVWLFMPPSHTHSVTTESDSYPGRRRRRRRFSGELTRKSYVHIHMIIISSSINACVSERMHAYLKEYMHIWTNACVSERMHAYLNAWFPMILMIFFPGTFSCL
jgi:hypothetical protein